MFNELNKSHVPFTVDSSNLPFVSLSDLIKENGHRTLKVEALYSFIPKSGRSKGKEQPVMVAEGHNIYLPQHLLQQVKDICSNDEYRIAINNGKCGFKTREYEDTKNGAGTCYSGNFVDI